jgi:hypothetical protein
MVVICIRVQDGTGMGFGPVKGGGGLCLGGMRIDRLGMPGVTDATLT